MSLHGERKRDAFDDGAYDDDKVKQMVILPLFRGMLEIWTFPS